MPSDCEGILSDLSNQEHSWSPRFTEKRVRGDTNIGAIHSLSTAASALDDVPFTWDASDESPLDLECETGELTGKQLTVLHRVLADFKRKLAETAVTAQESHHRVTLLAGELAQEAALRKASDVARALEIRGITQRLECDLRPHGGVPIVRLGRPEEMPKAQHQKYRADVNELWRGLRAETKARQDMVRNFEKVKWTTKVVAAALEKLISEHAEERQLLATVRECSDLRARTEEIAGELRSVIAQEKTEHSSCHGEIHDVAEAVSGELRAEVCEQASCELSTMVRTAEADMCTFITEISSSCESELARLFQTCHHARKKLRYGRLLREQSGQEFN